MCSLLLALAALALARLGLNPFFTDERVPFDDIRWSRGRPEILLGGEWARLLSVNGVKVERLTERAIDEWGTAYQERFVPGFNLLLEKERGGLNFVCELSVETQGGEKSSWALSLPRRYRSCVEAAARRQTLKWETAQAADVTPRPTRPPYEKLSKGDDGERLSSDESLEDLRHFAWTLEHRYAYLSKSKTPYRHLLGDIAEDAGEGISRRGLALRLEEVLALFDDIHSRVSFGASRIRLAEKTMPCELVEVEGAVACLKPDRRGYLDPERPLLKAINGVPLATLRGELAGLSRRGNDDAAYTREVLKYLKLTEFIAPLTGQNFDGKVTLTLESADGGDSRTVTLDCVTPQPAPDFTVPVETRIFKGPVGYLGLRGGMFPGEKFRLEIVNAMMGLRHTKGMILDLRGNPGGRRDAIPLLIRYFVPPGELPTVVDVAAVRMDEEVRPPPGAGLLRSRMLRPKSWDGWNERERELVGEVERNFVPTLELDGRRFSELHFMLVRGDEDARAYYYSGKLIVLHDGETASAAGLLLSALKGRANVRLMGSTSDSDGGYPQAYQLPNSRIVYWLSSMASFKPDGTLSDSVAPDVPYELTLRDLTRMLNDGADPLLESAAESLRR